MYIFPRQFGLHNVFTSKVDPKDTVQPFKDYTLREQEIAQSKSQERSKRTTKGSTSRNREDHVPRRLRGTVRELISKMQKLHGRCAYTELLRHYCPNPVFYALLTLCSTLLSCLIDVQGSVASVDVDGYLAKFPWQSVHPFEHAGALQYLHVESSRYGLGPLVSLASKAIDCGFCNSCSRRVCILPGRSFQCRAK